MISNIEKGNIGEKKAEEYLVLENYKIITKNYRTKIGEIDIIAMKDKILVFVEVKARMNINYGYPYEAVNWRKQDKIIKTSLIFMQKMKLSDCQMRYDIIEVYLSEDSKINHIENAF